jgi:soluble lytic murein transglycosylase
MRLVSLMSLILLLATALAAVALAPAEAPGAEPLPPAAGSREPLSPSAGAREPLPPAAGARDTLSPSAGAREPLSPATASETLSSRVGAGGASETAPLRLTADAERRYAAAIEAFRHGDPALVIREFGTDEALRSPIAEYTRLLYAEALLRTGDLAGAREAAEGIAERSPRARAARSSLLLAAYAAAREGDEARNEALLRRFLKEYPGAAEAPAALYLLGQSFEARDQREHAARVYREITLLAPASGYADGAADRLQALAGAGLTPPVAFTAEERLLRAERLLRGGVPSLASAEADSIVTQVSDPGLLARALLVASGAAQRLGRYEVAAQALELALPRLSADRRPALQLELGRLYHRAGKRDRALAVLAAISPSHRAEAADAAYQRGWILEQSGRAADAAAQYERTIELHPGREAAGAALWRLGWLAYLRGDRARAAKRWSRLLEVAGGRTHQLGAAYWSGRAHEEMGARGEAQRLYRRVLAEAPRSYYGILAAARARGRPNTGQSGPERNPGLQLPADPTAELANDPSFVRIATLQRIGLAEDAAAEMEDLVLSSVGDRMKLYALSAAYQKDEQYHLALRILRRHFAELAASGHPAVPRVFWEIAYPLPWEQELRAAAARHGLDPLFVAAVVREESSFYPRAVSRAGARGLMQLMPATAAPMAAQRGLAFDSGGLLDEPAPNLEMGAAFLAGLLQEFSDPRLALAAYNAGPRRLREWWRERRSSDLEVFVEQIPFDETRFYVKRVMASWEEYRRVYGSTASR